MDRRDVSTPDFQGVQFDEASALAAAQELDGLADRLERDLLGAEPALSVPPAGVDEVSVRAATTMTEVGTSFGEAAAAGVLELRKLAATLRDQVNQFGRAEQDNATGFSGTAVGGAA
ncbi:PE family protein [Nocardia jiangsuensis]|uniref:PE family protein n=1 Tax=Nocardia jiangsuensis TaxID=1691563 RepID=A0ABV8DX85_9NOCA